ncbi:hypothetical protein TSUD_234720 [Trifolium subterraneum]|uniref:Uncharacterized protein n=1 Tax=Trifolium subterraneum TaxID=3900 RepID=A0A2Z6MH29_TRISU|nr:hypothetical protein TSUD_234720 [Trifolium subterraneum]
MDTDAFQDVSNKQDAGPNSVIAPSPSVVPQDPDTHEKSAARPNSTIALSPYPAVESDDC